MCCLTVPNLILHKIKFFKNNHGTNGASPSRKLNRFKRNLNYTQTRYCLNINRLHDAYSLVYKRSGNVKISDQSIQVIEKLAYIALVESWTKKNHL